MRLAEKRQALGADCATLFEDVADPRPRKSGQWLRLPFRLAVAFDSLLILDRRLQAMRPAGFWRNPPLLKDAKNGNLLGQPSLSFEVGDLLGLGRHRRVNFRENRHPTPTAPPKATPNYSTNRYRDCEATSVRWRPVSELRGGSAGVTGCPLTGNCNGLRMAFGTPFSPITT